MSGRCEMELCPNWAGDDGCPCAVLGLPKPERFCCDNPEPMGDAGEPDEAVICCANCGDDMDDDMIHRWSIMQPARGGGSDG